MFMIIAFLVCLTLQSTIVAADEKVLSNLRTHRKKVSDSIMPVWLDGVAVSMQDVPTSTKYDRTSVSLYTPEFESVTLSDVSNPTIQGTFNIDVSKRGDGFPDEVTIKVTAIAAVVMHFKFDLKCDSYGVSLGLFGSGSGSIIASSINKIGDYTFRMEATKAFAANDEVNYFIGIYGNSKTHKISFMFADTDTETFREENAGFLRNEGSEFTFGGASDVQVDFDPFGQKITILFLKDVALNTYTKTVLRFFQKRAFNIKTYTKSASSTATGLTLSHADGILNIIGMSGAFIKDQKFVINYTT